MIVNAQDRIELERSVRERGDVGRLSAAAIHNVRVHAGSRELYGRDDWIAAEGRRLARLGTLALVDAAGWDAPLGANARMFAVRWALQSAASRARCAVVGITYGGRIVREWQYLERRELDDATPATDAGGSTTRRAGVDDPSAVFALRREYGDVRASPRQTAASGDAASCAAPAIAAEPVVTLWHRLWNARDASALEGYARDAAIERPGARIDAEALSSDNARLLAPFENPVMFCERLVRAGDGAAAALQWRLVGRHLRDAWGSKASRLRLTVHGVTFFALAGERIATEHTLYDELDLVEQIQRFRN